MSVRTQIIIGRTEMSARVIYLLEKLQSESLKDDQRDLLQRELEFHLSK